MAPRKDAYSITGNDELFKTFYVPIAEAAINTATPFRTTVKRIKNFTGKSITGAAKLSIGGGVGNGVIPYGSVPKTGAITYTPKNLFGTCVLDWEAVVSSGDDKGAFVDVTVDTVEDFLVSFTNNEERQMWGKSTGILGVLNTAAPVYNGVDANGDDNWSFTLSAATWFYPNWEAGNMINFGTDTTPFKITAVAKATHVVTVIRLPGFTFDPLTVSTTANVYTQFSKDKEYTGIQDIIDTVDNGSATLYGLRVQPRYEARIMSQSSKPLIPDMITEMVETHAEDTGVMFTDCWMNSCQWTALSNQLEGKKEYSQLKSDDTRYADMGFEMLTFKTRHGKIRLGTARFCKKDQVVFTTKEKMEVRERPRFGWLNFDGNKFLRDFHEGEVPVYKANYGGYAQFFAHPAHVGALTGLEVPAFAS